MSNFEVREITYMENINFRPMAYGKPNEIHTGGTTLGTHVYVKHKLRNMPYQVWHIPSHGSWGGVGMGQNTVPSAYMLVKVSDEGADGWRKATPLYEVEPGRYWRDAIAHLIALAIKENQKETHNANNKNASTLRQV